jgi:nitrite reductase (cytochrome c-552)
MAGKALVAAIAAIEAASKAPRADQKLLDRARQLHRQAQWYWDWVDAENSMGFHNPPLAMNTSGKAIDLAHRAREAAIGARLPAGSAHSSGQGTLASGLR